MLRTKSTSCTLRAEVQIFVGTPRRPRSKQFGAIEPGITSYASPSRIGLCCVRELADAFPALANEVICAVPLLNTNGLIRAGDRPHELSVPGELEGFAEQCDRFRAPLLPKHYVLLADTRTTR